MQQTQTGARHGWLGKKIRRARVEAGFSHDRLGLRVGTSRQHLIRLEQGVHKPRPALLAAIAVATGKPLEFFENDDDEEADPLVAVLMVALREYVRSEIRSGA